MSSIETRVDDFDLAAGPNFMLLMTFFCAAVAIALTVFILGWSLASSPTPDGSIVSSLTVIGP